MTEAVALAWRQYRLERRLFWRNPSAAFFNFLLPLLFLAFFGAAFSSDPKELRIIVPGIASMAVMSTTFTALAFNMTFLREQGVLKRIRGTPMPGISYLLGVAGNAVTNTALQIVIITVAGRVFFGTGWPREWVELVVFVIIGVVCFASLGVAFSHAIPNFDSAPAYVNAVFLPVIAVSGVFFDTAHSPAFMKGIAEALPLYHLIAGLSGAMVTGASLSKNLSDLGVIAVWAIFGILLAVRGFSWEQRRA
jgi:ABC-2 type transport system permease protein